MTMHLNFCGCSEQVSTQSQSLMKFVGCFFTLESFLWNSFPKIFILWDYQWQPVHLVSDFAQNLRLFLLTWLYQHFRQEFLVLIFSGKSYKHSSLDLFLLRLRDSFCDKNWSWEFRKFHWNKVIVFRKILTENHCESHLSVRKLAAKNQLNCKVVFEWSIFCESFGTHSSICLPSFLQAILSLGMKVAEWCLFLKITYQEKCNIIKSPRNYSA